MEIIGTITSKGQITIPRNIREALGLNAGDRLSFQIDQEHNLLLKRRGKYPSLAGILQEYGKGVTLSEDDIRNAVSQALAEH